MAYYNERRTVEELVLPLAFVAVVKDGIGCIETALDQLAEIIVFMGDK